MRHGVETAVIDDDLIAAWREAMQSGDLRGVDDALTTREICTKVFGWNDTQWKIRKTREFIRRWLRLGLIEPADVTRINILGRPNAQTGFRLVDGGG